jgi:outer membrane protein assembly factor BamB
MTLSPASVLTTAVEGESASVSATINIDGQVNTTNGVHLRVGYDRNVFTDPVLNGSSPTTALITFPTVDVLSVGDHAGAIEFYVCKDSSCAERYSEVAVTLSYRITITPAPPAAVITPTSFSLTVESGDSFEFIVEAEIRAGVQASAFGVEDSLGIFSPDPDRTWVNGRDRLTLKAPPVVTPGTYSGTVNLLLCRFTPCTRANKVPGSPVSIAYVVTVTPPVTLAPIPTLTGLPEWETFQGNPSHTGYVPVTLDAGAFSHRWAWTSAFDSGIKLSPVTTGSDKVVFSASGFFHAGSLLALNESDGSLAWRHDFGPIFAVNHPATSAGRIFVATSGHSDTAMWSFELDTGRQVFRTPFASQWEHYLAPVLKDSIVYTNGGYYGGMYAFKGTSGVVRWFVGLAQYDLWSPAVDGTHAYAHTGYEWVALDRLTGARNFTVQNPTFNWRGYALNIAPVIDTADSMLVVDGVYEYDTQHDNHLIRYNRSTQGELWRVNGRFPSNPATARGRVYVLNAASNALEAYDQASGTLLWSWHPTQPGETMPIGNIVVTDNLVFLSTTTTTYAIHVDSHDAVWNVAGRGHLAMSSNTVLYVVAPTRIDAYRLR